MPEARALAAAAAPAGIAWRPGDVILGLYEVVGILGEGGMGRVYRVRHPGWGLELAVKVPLPESLEAVGGADQFEREAETWVNLALHPHVVTCHYVRRLDGLPLVFAELVEGETLLDGIRSGRLASLEEILDVAIQFAWGLEHAHEQGLVHRDVKPANVLLGPGGSAKVTDFGLARGRSAAAARPLPTLAGGGQTLTVEGGGGGTPAYFSPEQARGDALTRRSDLWSFALSVLEAFLGERSWRLGLVAPEVLEAYRQAGLETPGLPRMPDPVAEMLGECFREAPDARPHGLGEVAPVLIRQWEAAAGRPYPRPKPRGSRGAADGLNNRAVSLVDLGREAEAVTLWRKALAAEPQHVEATYNAVLAGWAAGHLDDDEALRRLHDACAAHGAAPRTQELLGRLQLSMGRGEEARDQSAAAVVTLRGLSGPVTALAADAGSVAAASGSEVRVWDAVRGGLVRTLEIAAGPVRALALLPGDRVLVGAENAPLALWDAVSGRELRAWARHPGFCTALLASADGRLVISGGSDRVVRVWDPESGRCLHAMEGHEDAVTALAAGSSRLASASRDGTVRLWSLEDGRGLAVLRDGSGAVLAVALDEAASRVVSAGDDRVIRDWGLNSHELVRSYLAHTQTVHALVLPAAGGRLLSGSADGTLRAWDCAAERLVSLLRLDAAVLALRVAADGTLWAAHGSSVSALRPPPLRLGAAALCRPSSAVEVESRATSFEDQIEEARRRLTAGDFASALTLARTARSIPGHERAEAALSVWDDLCSRLARKGLQSAWEEARLEGHSDQVLAVAVDAGGRFGLTGSLDSTARLWDLPRQRPLAVLTGHEGAVTAVAFAGEASAVTAGRDRTLRVWDPRAGRLLRTLEGHEERVAGVAVSPDGSLAATAGWDATVRLWDLAQGRMTQVLVGHEANVAAVRFSADGRAVASAGWDGAVRIWHAESGEALCTLRGHTGNATAVAFHPAGRQVASGGEDRSVRLWDPRTRRCLRVLSGHQGEITAIAFSPDGRFLFSSSRDQSVRVWDARRGVEVRALTHPAAVLDLAPLPLGSRLFSAGADRVARLWHLDWEPESVEPGAPDPGETSRPFLETLVSRRNRVAVRSGGNAVPAWSEAEVDRLLADLHHRGFGTLTRESVSTELRSLTSSPRAKSFWDELRGGAVQAAAALPRAAVAVRGFPWPRAGIAALVLAAIVGGFLSWYKPKPELRLSPHATKLVRSEADLIDVGAFSQGCSAGDADTHFARVVSGNPEAHDVACLAATGSGSTANALLEGAPLNDPDPTRTARLRRNVASVLVGLGPAAVEVLCQRLGDAQGEVRDLAALSLGFADPAACEMEALATGTREARLAAAMALRRQIARGGLDTRDAWAIVERLLAESDASARIAGLSLLPLFAADVAEPRARPLADDADPEVAAAARKALGAIESARQNDVFG